MGIYCVREAPTVKNVKLQRNRSEKAGSLACAVAARSDDERRSHFDLGRAVDFVGLFFSVVGGNDELSARKGAHHTYDLEWRASDVMACVGSSTFGGARRDAQCTIGAQNSVKVTFGRAEAAFNFWLRRSHNMRRVEGWG